MNKLELIDALKGEKNLSKNEAKVIVDLFFNEMFDYDLPGPFERAF